MPKETEGKAEGQAEAFDPRSQADLTSTIDFFANPTPAAGGNAEYEEELLAEDGDEESEDTVEDDSDDVEQDDEQDESDDEDEDSDSDEEDEESDVERKSKHTVLKINGEEVEVPDGTKITLLVDGEEEVVTFGKMKQLAAGNTSYHRRFNELAEEKKNFKAQEQAREKTDRAKDAQLTKLNGLVAELARHMEKNNFEGILNEVVAYLDKPADAFWDHYDKANESFYTEFNKLSDAEKKALSLERKVVLRDAQIKRRDNIQRQAQATEHYTNATADILKNTSLVRSDVEASWRELEALAAAGKLSQEQITAIKGMDAIQRFNYAAAFALNRKVDQKVRSTIDKNFPKLSKKFDTIISELEEVMGAKWLLKASPKDLQIIIKKHYAKISEGDKPEKDSKKKAVKDRKPSSITDLGDKATPRHKAAGASQKDNDEYGSSTGRPSSQVWGASFEHRILPNT